MTLKEACKHALNILKQVMEEKLNATNVEVRPHCQFEKHFYITLPKYCFILDVNCFSKG